MFPVGFFVIALGMYLVDCAIQNRPPIATLEAIIADPKNLRSLLASSKGTGYASTFTGAGVNPAMPGYVLPATVPDNVNPQAAEAVTFARAQIGKPYRWGATGPNAFDCSGLIQAAYKYAGISLPRTTYQQITRGHRVSRKDLQLGDLVFPDPGHVQIYSGNGNVIEAPHTGAYVREVKMWGFLTARRVVSHVKVVTGSNSLAGLGGVYGTQPGHGGGN